LLPAIAALSSSPRSSSRVMEMLTVTAVTLPATRWTARSPVLSACRLAVARRSAARLARLAAGCSYGGATARPSAHPG
jgi:hypothetical protein